MKKTSLTADLFILAGFFALAALSWQFIFSYAGLYPLLPYATHFWMTVVSVGSLMAVMFFGVRQLFGKSATNASLPLLLSISVLFIAGICWVESNRGGWIIMPPMSEEAAAQIFSSPYGPYKSGESPLGVEGLMTLFKWLFGSIFLISLLKEYISWRKEE